MNYTLVHISKKIKSTLVIVMLFTTSIIAQVVDLNSSVPRDTLLRTGVLDNGITYYIRHNEEPKNRASFYVIQNVGALLEKDNQNGLAHFLEHMAFNGTESFPGKGIIDGFEKFGVKFGQNINAYTAYNETVYNISDVPSDNADAMDMGLNVLHDWTDYLLLTEEEIDSERGVISEEWRTRRDVSFRMRSIYYPVIFKGSMWEKRDVIGNLDIINNFDYKTIKDFYHDWYRTDLQAISIIGDFDAAEMEKKVIKKFSKIKAINNPKKRPEFKIPSHKDLRFVLATDKEGTQSTVNINIIFEKPKDKTLGELQNRYMVNLFNMMSSARINEYLQKNKTNCSYGDCRIYNDFVRNYGVVYITAQAVGDKEKEAFSTVYTEVIRIKKNGFLQSELDRAKATYLAYLETKFKSKDKINNDEISRSVKDDYLVGDVVTSAEFDYQFGTSAIKRISLEDVNAVSSKYIINDNRTVYITGPSEGINHISKSDIETVISKIETSNIEPYLDKADGLKLLDPTSVKGGEIISIEKNDDFSSEEWILSNGAKVIYRHADYDKDNISIKAWSKGGSSIYEVDELVSAYNVVPFVMTYGISDFDAPTLDKLMAGKNVSLYPYIGTLEEGFSGESSVKDFETLMQLLYLRFEKPRFDKNAFAIAFAKNESQIMSELTSPQKIIGDSIRTVLNSNSPRLILRNEEYINQIDFSDIEKIYKDRFSDASDFTFLIVGNMTSEQVKPMVEKYIGGITSTNRNENWVDRKESSPKGITHKKWHFPLETPKGTVFVKYSNNLDYNAYNKILINFIKEILNFRFTTEIREKEGGTYGVGVFTEVKKYPLNDFALYFKFDSDYKKTEYLKEKCYEVIDDFVKNGPTQDELNKVKDNLIKNRIQSKNHNKYWSSIIKDYEVYEIDNNNSKNYEDIINKLSTKDIKKATNKFFNGNNRIEMVILPQE